MKTIGPIFVRADVNNTVILASQSLAEYLGVEKSRLQGSTLESVAELVTGELKGCFSRAETGRKLDQLVVDGFSRVFEAKTWSEGGVFDLLLDEVTSMQPILDALRDSSSIQVDDLSEEEMATIRRPDRRTVTILSARLVNFSEFIERTTPIEARLVVGSFLDESTSALAEFGGVSFSRNEEFQGGIFGAPRSFADHALRALNAALRLSASMGRLRKASIASGREFPIVACGVASGESLVGTFGATGTTHYSALGAGPVMAQQLANLAQPGEVLITENGLQQILASLPDGWIAEEFAADNPPDLSRLRWSGEEVQPLPQNKDMRSIGLRAGDSAPGEHALVFQYIWSLLPQGTKEAIPVLRVEMSAEGNAEIAVSEGRAESSFLQIFGKYRLVKLVGSGGMGKVWKARDRFGNTVALKTLHQTGDLDPQQIKRFQREADVMSHLPHRNICRIYEAGEFEGIQYLTMEFVDGLNLGELLSRSSSSTTGNDSDLQTIIRKVRSDINSEQSKKDSVQEEPKEALQPKPPQARLVLPVEQALSLFMSVCEGVKFAHEHGVLHRDLKPGNIMLREDGEPLVADFGLAKFNESSADQSISVSGHVLGTLANMAPEQAMSSKDVDERADIYALGTILYLLMTGRRHFTPSGTFIVDVQRLQNYIPPCPSMVNQRVDADMNVIIGKSLAANPDDRYRSVQAFLNDLDRYRRGESITATQINPLDYGRRWVKRHRFASAAALAVLIFVVGGTSFGFWAVSQRASEAEQARKQLEKTLTQRDEATRKTELVSEERRKAELRIASAAAEVGKERDLRQKAELALQAADMVAKKETVMRKEAEAHFESESQSRSIAESRLLELAPSQSELAVTVDPNRLVFDQGMKSLKGDGVEKSPEKAFTLFLQAAKAGVLQAELKIGAMLIDGIGTNKDAKSGLEWMQKAADAGLADAQYDLAERLREGRGVPFDKAKAFTLYMKSAAQGHAWAPVLVGLCYWRGDGVPKNDTEALKWAELGIQQDKSKRARAHAYGLKAYLFSASDPQKSLQYDLQAAELGNIYAENHVVGTYLKGKHLVQTSEGKTDFIVEKTPAETRKWLTLSAEKGDKICMRALAALLTRGDTGVARNPEEASMWLSKANEPMPSTSNKKVADGGTALGVPATIATATPVAAPSLGANASMADTPSPSGNLTATTPAQSAESVVPSASQNSTVTMPALLPSTIEKTPALADQTGPKSQGKTEPFEANTSAVETFFIRALSAAWSDLPDAPKAAASAVKELKINEALPLDIILKNLNGRKVTKGNKYGNLIVKNSIDLCLPPQRFNSYTMQKLKTELQSKRNAIVKLVKRNWTLENGNYHKEVGPSSGAEDTVLLSDYNSGSDSFLCRRTKNGRTPEYGRMFASDIILRGRMIVTASVEWSE